MYKYQLIIFQWNRNWWLLQFSSNAKYGTSVITKHTSTCRHLQSPNCYQWKKNKKKHAYSLFVFQLPAYTTRTNLSSILFFTSTCKGEKVKIIFIILISYNGTTGDVHNLKWQFICILDCWKINLLIFFHTSLQCLSSLFLNGCEKHFNNLLQDIIMNSISLLQWWKDVGQAQENSVLSTHKQQ